MVAGNCWPSSVAREKARQPGKGCSRISIGEVWRARNCSSLSPTDAQGWPLRCRRFIRGFHTSAAGSIKMRNILEKVRKRDYEAVKAEAQAIYRADSRRDAEVAFRCFRSHWRSSYPRLVKQLAKDLPELLSFFSFPRDLWPKLRTIPQSGMIERCFVNAASVDRIVFSIFNRFNEDWRNRTLRIFTHAA